MILRQPQPELLDLLPPDDPAARHGRRDLVRINRIMRNHHWLACTLPGLLHAGERVLELGAGTGELAARLHAQGLAVDGLDLGPRPATWPSGRVWHQTDLTQFTGYGDYPVIVGNLIFHHFSDEMLAVLGSQWRQHTRLIVACEPARRRASHCLFRMLGPVFGANHVTMHDASISIAAGFRTNELPQLLGLDEVNWECVCSTTLVGAYHLVALRRP